MCRVWIDVDHFDFDEKDIEHYRKVNEQEAAERDRRRKQRALEKQRTAQNSSVKQRNQMNSRREKDRINRPLRLCRRGPVKKSNTKKKKRRMKKRRRDWILMI